MGTQVDGKVGDTFYCYDKGQEGWYRVNSPQQVVPISDSDVRTLKLDVQSPPTLKNYWLYQPDPKGNEADGGADLNHFSNWLDSKGGYMSAPDLKTLADDGTFRGSPVDDAIVRNTAKMLQANDNAAFKTIDAASPGGVGKSDSLIAPWDIRSALDGSQLKNDGNGVADLKHFSQWLSTKGPMSVEDLRQLADNGKFQGADVKDQIVRNTAKRLHENDDDLFHKIDSASPNGVGSTDGVIAHWDVDHAVSDGQVRNDGKVPTDVERFAQWLRSNGPYMKVEDLEDLAKTGTFNDKPVDKRVLEGAKKLLENDSYLFHRIDAVESGVVDKVIAPWDIDPSLINAAG